MIKDVKQKNALETRDVIGKLFWRYSQKQTIPK